MKQFSMNEMEKEPICRAGSCRTMGGRFTLALAILIALPLAPATNVHSQVILNSVMVGSSSGTQWVSVSLNPVTNKLYVANTSDGTVSIVNLATNNVTTVKVGTAPGAVAVNVVLNKAYVANYGSGNISVIDGVSDAVTATFALAAGGSQPGALIVNPVTNDVFVGDLKTSGTGTLYVLDGSSGSQKATLSIGTYLAGFAVDPSLNQVYAVGGGIGFLIVNGSSY